MFFISWGSRGEVAALAEGETLNCSRCEVDTHWTTFVEYRVRHVYWLFRWVTDRMLYRSCGNCGGVEPLDDRAVPSERVRAAIPALDRRGWAIGAGILASLFGLGTVAAAQHEGTVQAYLQAPRAGDVYEVDLARLMPEPPAPVMYSAMRVTAVTPEAVEVEVAELFYDRLRGVQRDVNEGRLARPGYFAPERMRLARARLDGMAASGAIADVVR